MKATNGLLRARSAALKIRNDSSSGSPLARASLEGPATTLRAEAGNKTAVLYIYEQIGEDFWTGGGCTAKSVVDSIVQAKKTGCTSLDVRILSEGGDAFEGIGIYEAIKRCGLKTTAYNDGLAASAASVILLACDRVVMAPTSTTMIHRAWSIALGNCTDMRAMADVLDGLDQRLADIYKEESGQKPEKCLALMDAESWLSANECLALGFCDEIAREESEGDDAEPDSDPDDASAMVRLYSRAQEIIKTSLANARMAQNAARLNKISTRASPGSKDRSGQSAA